MESCRAAEAELLGNIHTNLGGLKQLLRSCDGQWGGEDAVYRFWHGSLKVYWLQELTEAVAAALAGLCPDGGQLNPWFTRIVDAGTGKVFELSHNEAWVQHTRPIVDAYFHAHFMLTMVVRYGQDLTEPPEVLPSGWAAVLELYQIR